MSDRFIRYGICGIAVAAFLFQSSFAVEKEEEAVVEETPEVTCIDRYATGNYGHDLGVIKSDGTLNRMKLKNEAEWCARVLYGVCKDGSDKQKETVIWCIVNRMENQWYPDTIEDVCRQDYQFMGYSDTNPVNDDLLNIAYKTLYSYYVDGYKPVSSDFIYMYSDENKVELRDTFEACSGTSYWSAK